MVDFFRLLSMELGESKSFARLFEGRHNLDAALAQGRGVILLTAHLGHWEIGGLGLRALGYPLAVVTIRHNSVFTNRLINTLRSRHGIRVIELGDSPFDTIEIVRALNDQAVVAMLGDRAFSERSAPATFFGREVQLPVGPILLAMATGSPVVPAFSVMKAPGQYLGIIEPALNLRNGPEREDALRHNLQQVVAVFERYIRRYPDQWFQIDPM
jgi:KDO2-lipid IV(A) lauroyltransferase